MDEFDPKTELGKQTFELLERMQAEHGIEKTAGMLLAISMTAIQEIYGRDYLFQMYRALMHRLKKHDQTLN